MCRPPQFISQKKAQAVQAAAQQQPSKAAPLPSQLDLLDLALQTAGSIPVPAAPTASAKTAGPAPLPLAEDILLETAAALSSPLAEPYDTPSPASDLHSTGGSSSPEAADVILSAPIVEPAAMAPSSSSVFAPMAALPPQQQQYLYGMPQLPSFPGAGLPWYGAAPQQWMDMSQQLFVPPAAPVMGMFNPYDLTASGLTTTALPTAAPEDFFVGFPDTAFTVPAAPMAAPAAMPAPTPFKAEDDDNEPLPGGDFADLAEMTASSVSTCDPSRPWQRMYEEAVKAAEACELPPPPLVRRRRKLVKDMSKEELAHSRLVNRISARRNRALRKAKDLKAMAHMESLNLRNADLKNEVADLKKSVQLLARCIRTSTRPDLAPLLA